MKTAYCRLIFLFSCAAAALSLPWKPEISAGGSVSPRDSSLIQKTTSTQEEQEGLFVVKRNGRREPFVKQKVSQFDGIVVLFGRKAAYNAYIVFLVSIIDSI